MDNLEKKYAKNEQHSETLKLEVETLEKEVLSYQQQMEQVKQGMYRCWLMYRKVPEQNDYNIHCEGVQYVWSYSSRVCVHVAVVCVFM